MHEYLVALEAGERPDRAAFLARHADVAEELADCLEGLEFVHRVGPHLSHPRVVPAEAGPSAPSELQPEQPLGDYCIVREVGRGGMGVVYEAVQLSLGRRVALKVLPFAAALDARQLQRFKNEAQAAAHLHHQNIVPVYGVGCERGVHYYAMQFIDGQTLAAVIVGLRAAARAQLETAVDPERTGPCAPTPEGANAPAPEALTPPVAVLSTQRSITDPAFLRTVAHLGVQAAEALEHAHQLGVIHRDIKPANLLVENNSPLAPLERGVGGGGARLWITDFGLAHCQSQVGLTMTGDLLGTLRYMSPEQALAQRVVIDHRTDVYSLGVTLYELLALEPAFEGNDRQELLRQIAFEEPKPPRRLNKAVPADLETIVLKAMEKDPAARYATAREMADDLQRFLSDQSILAKRPTLLQRLKKWSRRHWAVLAPLLTMAGVAVFALLGGALWFNAELRVQRDDALRAKEKARAAYAAARLTLYAAHTHLAHRDWQDAHLGRALHLLYGEGCPADLRGWEWYYLRGLCHKDLRTLQSAPNSVPTQATFSPDGRWLAIACSGAPLGRHEPGTVELWDLANWQKGFKLQGHTDGVGGVAFSPDSRWLASASDDGTVKLWEVDSGKEIRTLKGEHDCWVRCVAFRPGGGQLASGKGDGKIVLWDSESGKEIRTLPGHKDMVNSIAFSPDGRRLASASNDKTVKLWDAATGRLRCTLLAHKEHVQRVAFSPDGQWLASASEDQTVKLWDPITGKELRALGGHTGFVMGVDFGPTSRQLASASADGTVRLWDPASGRTTLTLRGHTNWVLGVAFSPDGKRLASCGYDGTVKLWDPAGGPQVVQSLPGHKNSVIQAVAFAPDSKTLASAARDGTLKLWSVLGREPTRTLQGQRAWVQSVAFSPDGWQLASGSWDKTVIIWDRASGNPVHTCTGHSAEVLGVAFSPDGRQLASASADMTLKLWDTATGREIRTLTGHTDRVGGVAFHPGGQQLASGSGDMTVKLWNTRSGKELRTFRGHTGPVRSVAFSSDGRRLASGSGDGSVKLWDTTTGEEVFTLRGHADVVQSVAFSPDGRRLASGSEDGSVKLWDTARGHETLTLTSNPRCYIYGLAFSPDGRWLAAAGGMDESIQLWEAPPLTGE
jgi:WD40 repeat protein/serine/threonine protein kinase